MAAPLRAKDPAPSIKVTLDLHDTYFGVDGTKVPPTLRDPRGYFHVLLENTSAKPIWIVSIDDDFYANLTIEITDASGKTTSCQPAMYTFSPTLRCSGCCGRRKSP